MAQGRPGWQLAGGSGETVDSPAKSVWYDMLGEWEVNMARFFATLMETYHPPEGELQYVYVYIYTYINCPVSLLAFELLNAL